MKLTKQEYQEFIKFNKKQKQKHEPLYSEQEYYNYIYAKSKYTKHFKPLKQHIQIPPDRNPYQYPSCTSTDPIKNNLTNTQEKIKISQQYIIAPVCNKGAYQLMLPTDLKTMGRKI